MRLFSIFFNALGRRFLREPYVPPRQKLKSVVALVPTDGGEVIHHEVRADGAMWPPQQVIAQGKVWAKGTTLDPSQVGDDHPLRGRLVYVEVA